MAYGPETRNEVRQSCAMLTGQERTAKVHEWAHTLGVHPSTVYRWVEGDRLRRSRRADKGRRRVDVPEEDLRKMTALSVRYGMQAEDVVEHAEANEWISPGALSPATYNRILRERKVNLSRLTAPGRMDGKQVKTRLKVTPHRRWEAPCSNYLHQIDTTELPRYFVESDGSIGFESPLTFGRNKRGNARPRLNLFVIEDDFSRAAFSRFYYGKNVLNWIDFCIRAWDAKEDSASFPFCGRPVKLYSDNDSAPKAGMFTQFITDMDVDFDAHTVGNPRAKGKVERLIGVFKAKLTALLRVYIDQGRQVTLTEANDILHDLLYKHNYKAHSVTKEQPFIRWSAGLAGPARMMPSPEVRERYFYDSAIALVRGDLTIQFGGAIWQLPRREPFISVTGEKVPLYFHRGEQDLARILVLVDDREYPIETRMAAPDVAGDFKALPKGRTERYLEEIYDEDLADFQAGRVYADRYRQVIFPAQQEAFDESRISGGAGRVLSKVQLKLRLVEDGVRFSPEAVDAIYAEGEVLDADYERIVTRLRAAG